MPGNWSHEQVRNAQIIVSVGRQLGASPRDIQIALMTALVESNLRNVNYGDRDSLGLFQQRASWGSKSQRTDPYQSARFFFQGGSSADGYSEPGLFDKHNRSQMSMGQAAQAVQVSAFPERYAERQDEAAALMGRYGHTDGVPGTLGDVPGGATVNQPTIQEALNATLDDGTDDTPEVNAAGEWTNPALGEATNSALGEATNYALGEQQFGEAAPVAMNPLGSMKLPTLDSLGVKLDSSEVGGWRKQVVNFANRMLGTPYVWGGVSNGGVDCSGLVKLAFDKAGIAMPRISADQARAGKRVGLDQLKPGDLVAWDNSSRNNGADHIAVYIGGGKIIEAARPGTNVQVSSIYDRGEAWGVKLHF